MRYYYCDCGWCGSAISESYYTRAELRVYYPRLQVNYASRPERRQARRAASSVQPLLRVVWIGNPSRTTHYTRARKV